MSELYKKTKTALEILGEKLKIEEFKQTTDLGSFSEEEQTRILRELLKPVFSKCTDMHGRNLWDLRIKQEEEFLKEGRKFLILATLKDYLIWAFGKNIPKYAGDKEIYSFDPYGEGWLRERSFSPEEKDLDKIVKSISEGIKYSGFEEFEVRHGPSLASLVPYEKNDPIPEIHLELKAPDLRKKLINKWPEITKIALRAYSD